MQIEKKDIAPLVLVGIVAAIFAFILSGFVFKAGVHDASSATAPVITSHFPDAYHDPAYTSTFNGQAIDPTQPISVGAGSNSVPFNSSQGQ